MKSMSLFQIIYDVPLAARQVNLWVYRLQRLGILSPSRSL